ncbi:hypothetical protein NP493_1441g00005 [Ridgeia piscesae]|uniref:Uncharacterized protein n=1 Tax=Ridgeia piscesae TaxID=27915 RepID=A0AAD9K3M3_RIDPI|nr:hypothetical protein NP493_1441g00005 [Ridgeia piscesae]
MARVVVVIATALLTIFLLSDTSVAATTRATIRLVNNGYEGLLVAIAETVPADQSSKVITRIKKTIGSVMTLHKFTLNNKTP